MTKECTIRKATIHDVKEIQAIINEYANKDLMLPRSINELYDNIRDYWIAQKDEDIIGCCALHVSWENLAEVKSLAVREDYHRMGIGMQLLDECIQDAQNLGIHRLFALTYQERFFTKAGFTVISKDNLPHKIWSECIKCTKFPDCDEIAVIKEI